MPSSALDPSIKQARARSRYHSSKAAGLALAVWALSGAAFADETKNLTLGVSAAFHGPSKGLGTELYRGAMAYLSEVNSKGGVDGRPVLVRAYDDGYDPAPALTNTARLVEKDDAFLLFNYVGTPTVTRVLPLLKMYSDRNLLLFFPFTGAQPQREPPYDRFVFNLRASYRQETRGLVENFSTVGRRAIAVFYQADAYGVSGLDGVKRALAASGRKVAGSATYERGTKFEASFARQVEILRRTEPDAVISIGSYAACAGFVRDARDAGWEVPIANVSFVGSESMLAALQAVEGKSGKSYTRNLINSQVVPSYEDTTLPAVREYRALMDQYDPLSPFAEAGYRPLRYSFVGLEGFLNAKLLVEVLRRMGPHLGERARLREAAEGIRDLDLGIGGALVSFGPDRHQGLDIVYFTTVEGGKFVSMGAGHWEALRPK